MRRYMYIQTLDGPDAENHHSAPETPRALNSRCSLATTPRFIDLQVKESTLRSVAIVIPWPIGIALITAVGTPTAP